MQIKQMFQRVFRIAVVGVALAAVFLVPATGADAGSDARKEASQAGAPSAVSAFVTVDAGVTIKDDETVIDARKRALDAARDEALMKAAEGVVDGAVLSREKPRLLRAFKPQRENLIEEMKILAEEERTERTFHVRITAKIAMMRLDDVLMKNLRDDRVIVVTSEKNMKRPLKRHILEHDLIAGIRKKGYGIVDYRTIKNKTVASLVSAVRQGNTEAVRKLGLYYLTDLVVAGVPGGSSGGEFPLRQGDPLQQRPQRQAVCAGKLLRHSRNHL
jgi:hypothetical protein